MIRVLRGRIATVAAVVICALLAVVLLVRLVDVPSDPLSVAVQATARWLLLPAYLVLAAMLVARRWLLSAVALVLVAGQIVLSASAFAFGPVSVAAGPPSLTMITANVLFDNDRLAETAADLAGSGAQVIVLEEVTQEHLSTLQSSPLWEAYPHRVLNPEPGYGGEVLLSRLPLADEGVDVSGVPSVAATVSTPDGPVRILGVHLSAPLSVDGVGEWRDQLDALAGVVADAGDAPLVIAGDLNATTDHAPLRSVLDAGATDAFSAAGSGLGLTWPQGTALMRIDHVLVTGPVTAQAAATRPNPGSDHLQLEVRLSLHDPTEETR